MKNRAATIAFFRQECGRIFNLRQRYRDFLQQYEIDRKASELERYRCEVRSSYMQSLARIRQRISYPLPSFLVSFPRSGSNFIQHVIEGSSGFLCKSIYSPHAKDIDALFMYKSHALSADYLADEMGRLLGVSDTPSRLIYLYRDPRDVMISFYEYVCHKKNISVDQTTFLRGCDFFYASTIDLQCQRKRVCEPMSILDAYRMHIASWFVRPDRDSEILFVRYEDVLSDAEAAFAAIFGYLQLSCSLKKELLENKVSIVSNESRERARAFNWMNYTAKYGALINEVNELLSSEIELLGYESDRA